MNGDKDGERRSRRPATVDRRGVLRGIATGTVAGTAGLAATGGVGGSQDGETGEFSPSSVDWEEIFDAISGGCLVTDWPDPTENRIDLSGEEPTEQGTVPEGGDLVIYLHGFGGEDIGTAFTGAHQASGLDLALQEEALDVPVVAAMWSSLVPPIEPESAAETLAAWLDANHADYDSLVLFAHSLGALVTVEALTNLVEQDSDATLTSVGLLGGAVPQSTVCGTYSEGIESIVEDSLYNYHSEDDFFVCDLGSPVDGESGIGCTGTDCEGPPDNYVDVDLTNRVIWHCNYLKPEAMSFPRESGVPELVDRQFADLFDLPRGTVTGTVTVEETAVLDQAQPDEEDVGDPSEVELSFVDTETETLVRTAITAEDGGYEATLPASTYTVTADGPGLQPSQTTVSVADGETVQLDITLTPLPLVVGDGQPADLNGDGLYRDINGDGTFDAIDVQMLFANLDNPVLQDNPELFDFSATGGPVSIFDVQALFNDLADREELGLDGDESNTGTLPR